MRSQSMPNTISDHGLIVRGARSRSWMLLLAIASLVLTALPFPGAAVAVTRGNQGLQYGAVIDNTGTILLTDEALDKLAASGAGWLRINFRLGNGYYLDWTDTTAHGYPALERYDTIVNHARTRGLQVLGELSNEAWNGWLSMWQASNAEVSGGNGDNPYLQEFSRKAAVILAQHFAGRIDTWEVWNEPSQSATYLYPSNFAQLLAHVYTDTRAAGITSATFVSGGITSLQDSRGRITSASSGADYLKNVYAQGKQRAGWETIKATYGSYPLDHVGQHIYVDGFAKTTSAHIRTALKLMHDAYVQSEGGTTTKKTILTEFGWATNNVSEGTQATNLQTAYTEYKNTPYVLNAYWFFLRDESAPHLYFGLIRSDSSQKPAWAAYQAYATY